MISKGDKRRPDTRFLIYAEQWILGSTRTDLEHDERAIFIDLLALASLKGGRIEVFSREQLASQLCASKELVDRTVEKCIKCNKIRKIYKKREKKEIFSFVNWERYQPKYLWGRPERLYEKKGSLKDSDNDADVGEERKGKEKKEEEKKNEERRGKENGIPSHPRDQFLLILKEFSEEYPYHFDYEKDAEVYDLVINTYRDVDPIKQLELKIEYWKENPGALLSKGKSPRTQLLQWMEKEQAYLHSK